MCSTAKNPVSSAAKEEKIRKKMRKNNRRNGALFIFRSTRPQGQHVVGHLKCGKKTGKESRAKTMSSVCSTQNSPDSATLETLFKNKKALRHPGCAQSPSDDSPAIHMHCYVAVKVPRLKRTFLRCYPVCCIWYLVSYLTKSHY